MKAKTKVRVRILGDLSCCDVVSGFGREGRTEPMLQGGGEKRGACGKKPENPQ